MKTHKSRSKFGAKMKSSTNKIDSKLQLMQSRTTRRKLERQKSRKVINL